MPSPDWAVFPEELYHLTCAAQKPCTFGDTEFSFARETIQCKWCKAVPPEAVLYVAKSCGAYELMKSKAKRLAQIRQWSESRAAEIAQIRKDRYLEKVYAFGKDPKR